MAPGKNSQRIAAPRLVLLLSVLVVGRARAIDFDPASPDEFLFGFNQVGSGTGSSLWALSDEELRVLTAEIGINAMRICVHPATVGFPQRTWVRPEAVVYSGFTRWVWDRPLGLINSLDEFIRKMIEFDIYPILLPLTVDDYQSFMYKKDLSFLNASRGVDYTGIDPQHEFQSYAVAVAQHVQETFDLPFGIVFSEVCAQNRDNASQRGGEKEAWQAVKDAVRAVARGQKSSARKSASAWRDGVR